jgi:hypothetical protein
MHPFSSALMRFETAGCKLLIARQDFPENTAQKSQRRGPSQGPDAAR